jgi:N-glycosylase/DNA lyase
MTCEIRVGKASFDLDLCLTCGQVFRWWREAGGWYGVDGPDFYRASQSDERFMVETSAAEERIQQLFGLDEDTIRCIERLSRDEGHVGDCVRRLSGLRLMRPVCPVETLFSFLAASNNNLARIRHMVSRLASFGDPLPGAPASVTRFPTVERIAELTEEDLRCLGFGYRARTVPLAARRIMDNGGEAWLRELAGSSYEEAQRGLKELPGVGSKLADCIALFGLRHGEAVPVDTHVWMAMTRTDFPQWRGLSLTERRYRAVGDHFRGRFGRLAGMAHHYVFVDALLQSQAGRRPGSLPRPSPGP